MGTPRRLEVSGELAGNLCATGNHRRRAARDRSGHVGDCLRDSDRMGPAIGCVTASISATVSDSGAHVSCPPPEVIGSSA